MSVVFEQPTSWEVEETFVKGLGWFSHEENFCGDLIVRFLAEAEDVLSGLLGLGGLFHGWYFGEVGRNERA